MALPANVGFGTVKWKSMDSLGADLSGTVTFTPSPKRLLNATADPDPVTILPRPVIVTLTAGGFTQALVATDDPQNNPSGWTYKVVFKLDGVVVDPFDIEVPEGATVDLTLVSPVSSGNGTMMLRGEGVVSGGTTGQVLAKASGTDYDTEWVDAATGGGAVDSVNGQTAVVVLDADDIADTTAKKLMTAAERTKLAGIATAATANSTDATLLARANHTGTQAQSTVTNLTTDLAAKADLVGGVIPTAQLPALAINETTVVANQAAMLALTAQRGDMAIRSDNGKTYVLATDSPSTLADWKEVLAAGQVQSVAGKTGVVSLVKGDVGLSNVDNTADSAKAFTATQISNSTTVGRSVVTATDAAAARTAIGAGTSSLAIGTTGSTAKAGNYTPTIADLPAGSMLAARWTGSAWPSRPTARTDVVVHWMSSDPAATNPPAGALTVDLITIASA